MAQARVRQTTTDQPAMVLLNIPTKDTKAFAYTTSHGCWLFHNDIGDVWDELHDIFDGCPHAIEESHPEREGYPIEIPCEWGEFLTSITKQYQPTSMSCDVNKVTILDEYSITDNWCVVIVPQKYFQEKLNYDEAVTIFRATVRAIFP